MRRTTRFRPSAAPALLTAACLFLGSDASVAQTPATPSTAATPAAVAAAGPLERAAVPVSTDNPIPHRISSPLPAYPAEETSKRTGTVTLRITIDHTGRVVESRQPLQPDRSNWPRVVDGKPMLEMGPPLGPAFVKAATASVSQWRYEVPARAPISLYVKLGFAPGAATELLWQDAKQPDPTPSPTPVTATTGVPGGVVAGVPGGVVGGVVVGVPGRGVGGVVAGLPPPPQPPPGTPVRVGGNIAAPRKIRDVKPVYPPEAAKARITGVVIVETTIDGKGRVTDARVIRSVPELDQAALDAVKQWEFTPTLLNGQPTPVIMSAVINFTLN